MTKGAYDINETYVGPSKDGSFRSCLCAMLVFVSICGIILIVAWPWRNSGGNGQAYSGNSIGSYDEQKGNKNQYPPKKDKENESYKPTTTHKPYKPPKEVGKPATTTQIPEVTTILHNGDETEVFTSKDTYIHNDNKFEKLKDEDSTTTVINEVSDSKELKEFPENNPEKVITTTEQVPTKSLNVDKNEDKIATETTETTTVSISKTTKLSNDFDQINKNDNDTTTTTDGTETTTDYIKENKVNNEKINDLNKAKEKITTIEPEDYSTSANSVEDIETLTEQSGEESSTKTQFNELKDKSTTTQQSNIEDITTEFYSTTQNLEDVVTVLQSDDKKLKENKFELLISPPTTPQPETTTQISDDLTTVSTVESDDQTSTIISRFKKENSNQDQTIQPKDDEDITTTTSNPESKKSGNMFKTMDVTEVTQKPQTEMTTLPSTMVELTPPTIMETEEVDMQHKFTKAPENVYKPNNVVDDCDAECRKVGARILSKINHSGDACEEFYDYACGGDNSDNVPEDNWKRIAVSLDAIGTDSPDVYNTFKNFYEHCLDYHTEFDYDKRLNSAYGVMWSVGQPDKDMKDEKSALTDLLTRLLLHDSSPLFDISVDVDKDSQNFIFQLNIGKRFSTLQDKYGALIKKQKCLKESKKHSDFSTSRNETINLNDIYKVYSNCLRNETYNMDIIDKSLELFSIYQDYEGSMDYVEKIMKLIEDDLPPTTQIRKAIVSKEYQVRKVSDLQFHYPMINWKQLFSNLVGKSVDDAAKVQVYFSDFFAKLFHVDFLTYRELHDSIIAMFAYDLYYDLMYPTQTNDPRDYCLHHASDLMKEVASSLYLKSFPLKDIEGDLKRVETLFDDMKTKLKELIDVTDWYGLGPKTGIVDKLNDMKLLTYNSASIWADINVIDNRMMGIQSEYGNYSEFRLTLLKRNRKMLYNMWNKKGDEQENVWWHFTTPYSTNPVSIYALNNIAFPPAMLFTKSNNIPHYLSLAKLGLSLAKAIGYHFDYTGIQTIALDKKTHAAYTEMKTCPSHTYPKDPMKMTFDGKDIKLKVTEDTLLLSANEHFAENMAINLLSEMSNKAVTDYEISWVLSNTDLEQTFSRERLFFIALGQEHCRKTSLDDFLLNFFENEHFPPSLILNHAISNSQLFNQVFKCKDGAFMNPVFTCKPFPIMDEPEYGDY